MNNVQPKLVSDYMEVSDESLLPKNPTVSVHIITYNHGPYLGEAIASIIAQKVDFPIEIVIGEDCSTDDTRSVALEWQRRYPDMIRVLYSETNIGMMANVRRVWDACRGEYVAFCEGDDYWIDPDKLSSQVKALSAHPEIDLSFHSCNRKFERNQREILSHVRASNDKVFTLSEVIAGGGDFIPTASILVRRSMLQEIADWFDTIKPPVGDYFIQIFGARKGGAYYINKPMSVYRKDVDVAWSSTTEQKIDSIVAYETRFFNALRKIAQDIPGQDAYLKRHITAHYSKRFLSATYDNFNQIRKVVIPAVNFLYDQTQNSGDIHQENNNLLKLARAGGEVRDMADEPCGISRQFLRVIFSLYEYFEILLKIKWEQLFLRQRHENELASFKKEAQKSYLIARWKRLCAKIVK